MDDKVTWPRICRPGYTRHMIRWMSLLVVVAAIACGSSSPRGGGGSGGTGGGGSGGTGGSGGSGPADLSMPVDLANAFSCGNTVCGGSEKCCVIGMTPTCATSCPDGGFEAQCNGPANCGGNPCCITIGSGFTVEGVECGASASACPPMVNATTQSGTDRACHVDADCVAGLPAMPAPQLPDCCTNTATMQHVCFTKAAVALGGWTCP
jgi:hypothetical protein